MADGSLVFLGTSVGLPVRPVSDNDAGCGKMWTNAAVRIPSSWAGWAGERPAASKTPTCQVPSLICSCTAGIPCKPFPAWIQPVCMNMDMNRVLLFAQKRRSHTSGASAAEPLKAQQLIAKRVKPNACRSSWVALPGVFLGLGSRSGQSRLVASQCISCCGQVWHA